MFFFSICPLVHVSVVLKSGVGNSCRPPIFTFFLFPMVSLMPCGQRFCPISNVRIILFRRSVPGCLIACRICNAVPACASVKAVQSFVLLLNIFVFSLNIAFGKKGGSCRLLTIGLFYFQKNQNFLLFLQTPAYIMGP